VLAAFLAAGGMPRAGQLLLVLACMVTARTLAMSANRLLDAQLDKLNPRTARRAIPSGALSRTFYTVVLLACAAAFVGAAAGFWMLYHNVWPLALSVPVLLFLSAYPLLKRFTRLCHYYLGAALALAPVCAWVAIAGRIAPPPLWMAAAVLCWTAGFDIIYACQDVSFDRQSGLHSVPARIGVGRALRLSRALHVVAVAFLAALFFLVELHPSYLLGVASVAVLLAYEQSLVREGDLSRVDAAFFTVNGWIGVLYLLFVAAARWLA
jgi:4-hydroxybenzoate polyprenyltransferase